MRPSPLRHPLAVLRTTIGLTQDELARLVKRSARTIQAVELGKLPLSEELALLIAQETGVDPAWLMEADASTPPRKGALALWAGLRQTDYDKSYFEYYRAFAESPACPAEEIHARLGEELVRSGHGSVSEAAKTLLKQASSKTDPESIRLAKGLLAGPQSQIFAREDQQIEHTVKQLLAECAGTERATLVRWKLRRFLQTLAQEHDITLTQPVAPPAPSKPASPVKRLSGWFQFTPPPGWAEAYNGNQDVFTRGNATLVVTTYRLAPCPRGGEAARNEQLRQRLLPPAANTPFMKVTKEPVPDMRPSGVLCWTGEAETADGKQLFIQSMYVHENGMLLATFSAPKTVEAQMEFDRFARSVAANEEQAPERGERPPGSRFTTDPEQRAEAV